LSLHLLHIHPRLWSSCAEDCQKAALPRKEQHAGKQEQLTELRAIIFCLFLRTKKLFLLYNYMEPNV
jgi:hypothetical protein